MVLVIIDLSNKTKDTYVLLNNHYNAQAPQNATVLQKLVFTTAITPRK
jgi:uncharacterized protein YecE (DUF72 family)